MGEGSIQKQMLELKVQAELNLEKYKLEKKLEMENLRHQHIMEEIKALDKAKIKSFVRQIKE